MADEYINRAKFCEYLRTRKAESADDYGRGWKNGIIATEKAARGFPAADVAPVIHGSWVPFHSQAAGNIWYCSACEIGFAAQMKYCPNCGARMDLEE